MKASESLKLVIQGLFNAWFSEFMPCYNDENDCFWPEKNRYLVCIYDLKRELHRYKIITTTCTKFAVLMDKIICTFGYNICSPLKLLFVKNW